MRKVLASVFFFSFFFSLIVAVVSPSAALDRQPNPDYHARREALSKKAAGVIVLFAPMENSAGDAIHGFRQDENFYYLSGLTEPGTALLIASAAEAKGDVPARPYTEILFLPARNLIQEKWTGPKLGPESADAPKVTGFDRVEEMGKLPDEVTKLLTGARPVVYTDVSVHGETSASAEPIAFLKRTNSYLGFQDIKPALTSLRTVKDAGEIALLRKAVDASVAAHVAAFKAVKPNVPELEIAALMQYEWGKRGCERPAYAPIVGSGYYSTVLHYAEDSNTMKAGDVVVIDAAGEYSMYAADITRTLPVNGHFTARQREIYDIVLGAQEAAMAAFQSGKSGLTRIPRPHSTKSPGTISTLTAKTCTASPWGNILFTVWDITLDSTYTTPATTKSLSGRGWFSLSSPAFISPKKISACASKTISWSTPTAS